MSYRIASQVLAATVVAGACTAALAAAPGRTSTTPPNCSEVVSKFRQGDPVAPFYRCAREVMKTFEPPRLPDGTPNLEGLWMRTHTTEAIEERPEVPGLSPPQRTMIADPPDGKIPFQPWALEIAKTTRAKYVAPTTWCAPGGLKFAYWGNSGGTQIVQGRDVVALVHERFHEQRIIRTDVRPPLGTNIRLWNGDARGRWEGNTLVVSVANFNGLTTFSHDMDFASEDVRTTERYTLIAPNMLLWEGTIDDPRVFTRPWKMVMPLIRNPDAGFELMEEACHEDIVDLHNFFDQGQVLFRGVVPPR